jgi:amino acid transporter
MQNLLSHTILLVCQEAKNPARDLPIATLASLGVSTLLYIAVAFVAVGVVPYQVRSAPTGERIHHHRGLSKGFHLPTC